MHKSYKNPLAGHRCQNTGTFDTCALEEKVHLGALFIARMLSGSRRRPCMRRASLDEPVGGPQPPRNRNWRSSGVSDSIAASSELIVELIIFVFFS